MTHPTDDQLRQMREPSEDHFIERKSFGDSKDWLKTAVAFANSTPLERFAVLYIGIRDDGTVEGGTVNPDAIQQTVNRRLAEAYPPIAYTTRVLAENAKPYLCVIIPGSPERPHFAGAAFVRTGPQTIKASPAQFDRLVTQRNSKAYSILQCVGMRAPVAMLRHPDVVRLLGRVSSESSSEIVDCSTSTVVLRGQGGEIQRISLERVQVVDDPESDCGIRLEIRES